MATGAAVGDDALISGGDEESGREEGDEKAEVGPWPLLPAGDVGDWRRGWRSGSWIEGRSAVRAGGEGEEGEPGRRVMALVRACCVMMLRFRCSARSCGLQSEEGPESEGVGLAVVPAAVTAAPVVLAGAVSPCDCGCASFQAVLLRRLAGDRPPPPTPPGPTDELRFTPSVPRRAGVCSSRLLSDEPRSSVPGGPPPPAPSFGGATHLGVAWGTPPPSTVAGRAPSTSAAADVGDWCFGLDSSSSRRLDWGLRGRVAPASSRGGVDGTSFSVEVVVENFGLT